MNLVFDDGDEDGFHNARAELVERFGRWPHRHAVDAEDIGLALDWKWGYDDGDLGTWRLDQLDDLLLDWFPRKVAMPPADAPRIVDALRCFFGFLAAEGLLGRGSSSLAALDNYLVKIGPRFQEAMGDRSGFGMGKSMIASLDDLGLLPDGDDPDAARKMMEAFNNLPFDERGRILGISGPPPDPWRALTNGIVLPPAPFTVTDEVRAAIAAHALVRSTDTIRSFVGDGRKVTAKGNLGVADAKELATLLGVDGRVLGTTDEPPPFVVRSADHLPALQYRMRLARACGAVKLVKGRLSATASWRKLDGIEQVGRVVDALLDKGPLTLSTGEHEWVPVALHDVLEAGLPHLLAVLWAVGEPLPFDELAEAVLEVCTSQLRWGPYVTIDAVGRRVTGAFDDLLALLGEAGLVDRNNATVERSRHGGERIRGGELALTPLGRSLLGTYLTANGYDVPVVGELADGPLDAILDHIDDWHHGRVRAEFDAWVARHSPAVAADELGRIAVATVGVGRRIALFNLAEELPPPNDERAMRAMLDSPMKGHAVIWLLEHGHDDVAVDQQAMLRAAVDVFAARITGDPDGDVDLVRSFGALDEPTQFIDDIWRITEPQTGDLLAAIGRLHPDAAVAKYARKALIRHRSHAANLR